MPFADNPEVLVRLRWMAIIFQFLSVGIALFLEFISYKQFVLSIAVLIPAFVFNQVLTHTKYKGNLAFLQVLFDLLIAFGLLFINGGLKNPYYLIILVHIFLAPFFLTLKFSIAFICIGLGLLYSLKYSPFTFAVGAPNFFVENLPAFSLMIVGVIIWTLAHWLFSELKKLNERVETLKNYGQRIDKFRSLGLLTSGICHELGTPLNTALMKLTRIHSKGDNEDLSIVVRNLSKCSDSLKKLNLKIHDLSEDSYQENVNIYETLDFVANEYSKNYALEINMRNSLKREFSLSVPKLLLVRSVIDIFDNAIDAGANRLEISLLNDEAGNLKVSFQDNGNGFSNEVLNNLGTPFNTSKDTGTGLGLYQLINMVNYIGGKVDFNNQGDGAVIEWSIPSGESK